jgi:hypothetical protein
MDVQLDGDLKPLNSRSDVSTVEQALELSNFNTGEKLKKNARNGEVDELIRLLVKKLNDYQVAAEERIKEAEAEEKRLARSEEREERLLNAIERLVERCTM